MKIVKEKSTSTYRGYRVGNSKANCGEIYGRRVLDAFARNEEEKLMNSCAKLRFFQSLWASNREEKGVGLSVRERNKRVRS